MCVDPNHGNLLIDGLKGNQNPCRHGGSGRVIDRSLSVQKSSWVSPGDRFEKPGNG